MIEADPLGVVLAEHAMTSSGSAVSAKAVKPRRSTNTTVTSRRCVLSGFVGAAGHDELGQLRGEEALEPAQLLELATLLGDAPAQRLVERGQLATMARLLIVQPLLLQATRRSALARARARTACPGSPRRPAGTQSLLASVYRRIHRGYACARCRQALASRRSLLDLGARTTGQSEVHASLAPRTNTGKDVRARALASGIGACLEKSGLPTIRRDASASVASWPRQPDAERASRAGRPASSSWPAQALFSRSWPSSSWPAHRRSAQDASARGDRPVFVDLRGFSRLLAEDVGARGSQWACSASTSRDGSPHHGARGHARALHGDGYGVLHDPVEVPNPAERAIRMAVAMRDLIDALSTGGASGAGISGLKVGIARATRHRGDRLRRPHGLRRHRQRHDLAARLCARPSGRPDPDRGSGRVSG